MYKRFWHGVLTFGMAITIPTHEMELWEKLVSPAWTALALQNDIFSWPKERDAAEKNQKKDVVNAVWVLMGEHSIGEQEALKMVRELTKEYVSGYEKNIEERLEDQTISVDLRRYLEAILWTLSGNAVWSIACPRYNPDEVYNASQLELMNWGPQEADEMARDEKSSAHVKTGFANLVWLYNTVSRMLF
jgi:hypothetical protein